MLIVLKGNQQCIGSSVDVYRDLVLSDSRVSGVSVEMRNSSSFSWLLGFVFRGKNILEYT